MSLEVDHVAHHSFRYLSVPGAAEHAHWFSPTGDPMCIGEPVNERGHAGCLELRQGAQFLIQQVATEINAVKRKLLHCFGELQG